MMIRTKDRMVGNHYKLTYTKPIYDRKEQRYLPDNFRFVEPTIRLVSYGGKMPADQPRYCAICGRRGSTYMFLDLETFQEFFVSQHCLTHAATRMWDEDTPDYEIIRWYEREDIERRAQAGDGLAGLTLALEELEGSEYDD